MEALYNKMGEFLQMKELLPADEFFAYYRELMAFLQEKYQDLCIDELIKVKGICAVVYQNAYARARLDAGTRNKFRKIGEKCEFWANAVEKRLLSEGLTPDAQEEMEKKLWGRAE